MLPSVLKASVHPHVSVVWEDSISSARTVLDYKQLWGNLTIICKVFDSFGMHTCIYSVLQHRQTSTMHTLTYCVQSKHTKLSLCMVTILES